MSDDILMAIESGRKMLAKEINEIIGSEEKAYRDGAYRYVEDYKHNALLAIEKRCKTIIK